jgi:hypothetical protein
METPQKPSVFSLDEIFASDSFRLRSFSCEQGGAFTLESGEAARSYV